MRIRNLLLGIACGLPLSSFAQMGFGGGDMKMPNTDYFPMLLMNKSVQQELHVSPQVANRVTSTVMQEGMKMLPYIMKKNGGAPTEADKKAMFAAYDKMTSTAIAPLNSAQRARLHQLTLQFYGPAALIQPKISNELHLSAAQKSQLSNAIATNARSTYAGFKPGAGSNPMAQIGEMQKKQKAMREANQRMVDRVLTPAQKARWAAMEGKIVPNLTIMGGLGGM